MTLNTKKIEQPLDERHLLIGFLNTFNVFFYSHSSEAFTIPIDINLAADKPKVNSNQLRDVLHDAITNNKRIGELTVQGEEYSFRVMEGKCPFTATKSYTETHTCGVDH